MLAGVLGSRVEQFADELPLGVIDRRRHAAGLRERVGHDLRRGYGVGEREQEKVRGSKSRQYAHKQCRSFPKFGGWHRFHRCRSLRVEGRGWDVFHGLA